MDKSFKSRDKHISNVRTTDCAEVHGNEFVLATYQEMRYDENAMDRYVVCQGVFTTVLPLTRSLAQNDSCLLATSILHGRIPRAKHISWFLVHRGNFMSFFR